VDKQWTRLKLVPTGLAWYFICMKTLHWSLGVLVLGLLLPTATFATSFSRDLYLGLRGGDVAELQRLLNSNPQTVIAVSGPGAPGKETNYYGALTQAAVLRFQLVPRHGIQERDGFVLGPTKTALNQLAQNRPPSEYGSYSTGGDFGLQGATLPGYSLGGGGGLGGFSPWTTTPGVGTTPQPAPRAAAPNVNLSPITAPAQSFSPVVPQTALIEGFSVTPVNVRPSDPVMLTFSADSQVSYRLRIDCAYGVNASNQYGQELCRSTNVLKANAAPYTIRFSNATGVAQSATLHMTAHDPYGNILDARSQVVQISSQAYANTYVNPSQTTSSPFSIFVDGITDDGATVVSLAQGATLTKSVTAYFNSSFTTQYYGAGAPQQIVFSVSMSGLLGAQALVSPATLTITPGQQATAQLQLTANSSVVAGDYRVTITATSAGVTQTRSFILRVGSGGSAPMSSQTADLVLTYVGVTSLSRGQNFTPIFSVREGAGVAVSPIQVRASLYDLFWLPPSSALYGYEPQQFTDQSHVLTTTALTVSTGYANPNIFSTTTYSLTQPGTYKVCATIDTANSLSETSKYNNIACGIVTVQ